MLRGEAMDATKMSLAACQSRQDDGFQLVSSSAERHLERCAWPASSEFSRYEQATKISWVSLAKQGWVKHARGPQKPH